MCIRDRLRSEKLSLEQEIGTLMAKKKSIEDLIEKELKPQVFNLKEKLSAYKLSLIHI